MSTTKDQQRTHGSAVAVELGWLRRDMGLVGAAGGLLDSVSQPMRKLRSSRLLVDRHRKEAESSIRIAVAEAVLKALQTDALDGSFRAHIDEDGALLVYVHRDAAIRVSFEIDPEGRIRVSEKSDAA